MISPFSTKITPEEKESLLLPTKVGNGNNSKVNSQIRPYHLLTSIPSNFNSNSSENKIVLFPDQSQNAPKKIIKMKPTNKGYRPSEKSTAVLKMNWKGGRVRDDLQRNKK